MTRLEWTEPAVSDLENIQDYIARDSSEYADAVVERLILSVEQLQLFPASGRFVPEAKDPRVRTVGRELQGDLSGEERCGADSYDRSWGKRSGPHEAETLGQAMIEGYPAEYSELTIAPVLKSIAFRRV